MEPIILSPINIGELKTLISESVINEIKNLISVNNHPEPTELISRKVAAQILGVSLVTLNSWQKTGRVPAYRINTRVRFKRDEVISCLNVIQTKSFGEAA